MTPTEQAFQIALQANIPVILWGLDGQGKSSYISAVCEALDWGSGTLIGSTCDPTDVGGLPVIVDGQHMRRIPHRIFAEACEAAQEDRPYVVFLDEMNGSPPAVLSSMLNLLTAYEAGDTKLPDSARFVAAANPPHIAVNASDFQPPTCTRMVHLDWVLAEDTWDAGMLGDWPVPAIKRLPESWENGIPQARALVVAFRKRFPECFHVEPTQQYLNKPRSTPRTLDYLARLVAAAESANAKGDVLRLLANGIVGEGVGGDFSPEEALKKAATLEIPEERGDLCYLLFCSVAAHVVQNPSVQNWQAAWQLIGRTENTAAIAHAALAAQTLASLLRQDRGKKLRKFVPQEARIFTDIFREIGALSS